MLEQLKLLVILKNQVYLNVLNLLVKKLKKKYFIYIFPLKIIFKIKLDITKKRSKLNQLFLAHIFNTCPGLTAEEAEIKEAAEAA